MESWKIIVVVTLLFGTIALAAVVVPPLYSGVQQGTFCNKWAERLNAEKALMDSDPIYALTHGFAYNDQVNQWNLECN